MLDYYRSPEGRVFLLRQTLILLVGAAALSAIFGDGRVDLAVARWFYDDAAGAFPLSNYWLLKGVLHDAARTVSASAALVLCGLTAVAWATPLATLLQPYRRELLFAAAASLAAAAIVGSLKHFSAHACPWDLASFGGTAPYHPQLSALAVGSAGRGCFPAAHPLTGYAWLAIGFVLYPFTSRLARRCWSVAFALGTLFGAVQVARGAHFPSHVLWSAWAAWAVNVALLTVCVHLPRMRATRPARPNPCVDGQRNLSG